MKQPREQQFEHLESLKNYVDCYMEELPGLATMIYLCILRLTLAEGKTEAKIPASKFSDLTGVINRSMIEKQAREVKNVGLIDFNSSRGKATIYRPILPVPFKERLANE